MMQSAKTRKGQGLVEFALVLPILMMLALGIIDFAQVAFTFAQAQNSLREAIRIADIFGYTTDPNYLNCGLIENTAEQLSIATDVNATVTYLKAKPDPKVPGPGNWTVITEPITCGSTYATSANIKNGDIMKIRLTAKVNFLTPILNNMFPAFDMAFEAQRTIIKDIRLGESTGDIDGDGLLDTWEEFHFGGIDAYDGFSDPDGDGCTNGCEESRGLLPLDPDTDKDTLKDGAEIYTYTTDANDKDTDGDSVEDNEEVYYVTPLNMVFPGDVATALDPTNEDTDGDGVKDGEELFTAPHIGATDNFTSDPWRIDTDSDGLTDKQEFDAGTNPRGEDSDNDGLTDAQEVTYNTDPWNPDSDGDRLPDGPEVTTYHTLPDNAHSDTDGLADGDEVGAKDGAGVETYDVCNALKYKSDPTKENSDNEGYNDKDEVCGITMTLHDRWFPIPMPETKLIRTDPMLEDTDEDGLPDGQEIDGSEIPALGDYFTSDPTDLDKDTDNDTLLDYDEVYSTSTDPDNPDTNGDNIPDNGDAVICTDNDPANSGSDPDGGPDGLCDDWELQKFGNYDEVGSGDWDGDGCTNDCEEIHKIEPKIKDTDTDGLWDGEEVNGAVKSNPSKIHTDTDGLTDYEEVKGVEVTLPDAQGGTVRYFGNPRKEHSDTDTLNDFDEIRTHFTNPKLEDTDGDTLDDNNEIAGYTFTVTNTATPRTVSTKPYRVDSDFDGINDNLEIFGVSAVTTGNVITTVIIDPMDNDTDDDTVFDGEEINGYTVTVVVENMAKVKTSTDVVAKTDPTLVDTDQDGLGDGAEKNTHKTNPIVADTDQDGLMDGPEISGTTVTLPSSVSSSTGGGTATYTSLPLDMDSEDDGLSDGEEVNGVVVPGVGYKVKSNPMMANTDGDGALTDYDEVKGKVVMIGTYRTGADATTGNRTFYSIPTLTDSDLDTLLDKDEVGGMTSTNAGVTGLFYADPLLTDSDGDSVSGNRGDKEEMSTCPTNYQNTVNCKYKLTDPLMVDTDGDGTNDGTEIVNQTLPNNVAIIRIVTNPTPTVAEPSKNGSQSQLKFTVQTVDKTGALVVSPETITITWKTDGGGSATPGTDYISVSSATLTLSGVSSSTMDVPVEKSTPGNEPTETVYVTITAATNASIKTISPFGAVLTTFGNITEN